MLNSADTANTNVGDAQSTRPSLAYMPYLDGLRALAVGAVLLYHADIAWFAGGFLGVDVFFVLSGYLITSLLLFEWEANGRIDLPHFWLRRARRLLPALFVVIAATLTFALIRFPDEVARLRGDALAALAYCINWYQIFKQESYFEAIGRPSLFQHLWSLAIEEQFYLFWPPLLLLVLRRLGRRGALLVALVVAACSAALMTALYDPDVDPSRVYYGTDTRVFAPLLGAALACVLPRVPQTLRTNRTFTLLVDAAAIAALGGLAAACWLLDEYNPLLYSGGFVIVALLTAIVITALAHPSARLGRRLLSTWPLRWFGTRSYAIYLWHWPIFMVTRPEIDVPLTGGPLFMLRLGLTALLAELTYRFVETPFRAGALGLAWRRVNEARGVHRWRLVVQWSMSTALALGFAVLLGVAVVEARPPAPLPEQQILAVRDTPLSTIVAASPNPTAITPLTPTHIAPTITPGATIEHAAIDDVRIDRANAKFILPPTATPKSTALPTATPQPTLVPTGVPSPVPSEPPPPPAATEPPPVEPSPILAEVPTEPPAQPTVVTAEQPPAEQPAPPADAPPPPEPTPVPADPQPASALRVSAMGDSVMVGAAKELRVALGDVSIDAAVSRQAKAAIKILQAQRDAGQLGDVVIVHIGTNGPFSARQFDDMMGVLANVRRVVFVTVRVPRRWEGPNNAVIAEGVARYPNTVLADWYAVSAQHPELFARDGVHPKHAGAHLFAEVIANAVNAP